MEKSEKSKKKVNEPAERKELPICLLVFLFRLLHVFLEGPNCC